MAEQEPENKAKKRELPEGFKAKQFKPGQSGNPGGRPKTTPVTDMLRRIFEGDAVFAEAEIRKVLKGKSAVAKVMLLEKAADRLEGKVTQGIELDVNISLAERLSKARERTK